MSRKEQTEGLIFVSPDGMLGVDADGAADAALRNGERDEFV